MNSWEVSDPGEGHSYMETKPCMAHLEKTAIYLSFIRIFSLVRYMALFEHTKSGH